MRPTVRYRRINYAGNATAASLAHWPRVDAPGGTGTISYTGGELEDDEIQGSVDSVTVEEDGSFTVEGSWDGGEAFTLTGVTGSCTSL